MSASRVRALLIDLSGTLHIDETPTPGAVAALARLRAANVPIRFVTNTTKESVSKLMARLARIGFTIHSDEVFTSLSAARSLVQRHNLRPLLFLEPDALPDFDGIPAAAPHNAVVIGLAPSHFHYDRLNEAFKVLREGGQLIGIHKGRNYARSPGDIVLGPGPFIAALEYGADVQSQIVGKPSPSFFQLALDSLGVNACDAAMIGDDVRDDVGGAMAMGLQGFLVRTGKYTPGDETAKGVVPSHTFATFADAVDHVLAQA
ncbi:HAD-like domain-containing protein [Entophlyctis helioformis]|nr:HAD-like domain-containing protein [Entophlyctis helioformis]